MSETYIFQVIASAQYKWVGSLVYFLDKSIALVRDSGEETNDG